MRPSALLSAMVTTSKKKNHKIKLIINKFMIPFLIRASVAFYSGFHYRALLNYILYI